MNTATLSRGSLLVALVLPLVGCGDHLADGQFKVKGTVQNQVCWLVVDDGGKTYEPDNLPPSFQVDHLRVETVVAPAAFNSYCGWEQVHILTIDKQ